MSSAANSTLPALTVGQFVSIRNRTYRVTLAKDNALWAKVYCVEGKRGAGLGVWVRHDGSAWVSALFGSKSFELSALAFAKLATS